MDVTLDGDEENDDQGEIQRRSLELRDGEAGQGGEEDHGGAETDHCEGSL